MFKKSLECRLYTRINTKHNNLFALKRQIVRCIKKRTDQSFQYANKFNMQVYAFHNIALSVWKTDMLISSLDRGSVFAIVSCKRENCGEEKQKEEF